MMIDLDYRTFKLFPTPLHYINLQNFNDTRDKLIKYAYDLKSKDDGRNTSNIGGFQSQYIFINDNKDDLHNILINTLSNIPSFKTGLNMKCIAWVNISPPNAFHVRHCHPDCDVAGVLWIKAPKNSGSIVFASPFEYMSYREIYSYTDVFKKENKYYESYSYPPEEGAMILFPSHLQHHVDVNKSTEDRISISFNINILDM